MRVGRAGSKYPPMADDPRCAIVVAAASLPAPAGQAGVLLAAALASAVTGLVATIATSDPLALDIGGNWRPAGPFEYPPALGLVCVGGLPVAVCLAGDRRRAFAAAGALAAWLLIPTVLLTANRTAVALAALAATLCVALAPRDRRVGPVAVTAALAAAVSALVLHAGGRWHASSHHPTARPGCWPQRSRHSRPPTCSTGHGPSRARGRCGRWLPGGLLAAAEPRRQSHALQPRVDSAAGHPRGRSAAAQPGSSAAAQPGEHSAATHPGSSAAAQSGDHSAAAQPGGSPS